MTALLETIHYSDCSGLGRVGRKGSYGPTTALIGQVEKHLESRLAARGVRVSSQVSGSENFVRGAIIDTAMEDGLVLDPTEIADRAAKRIRCGATSIERLAEQGRARMYKI
jgi:hypothetical protein